MTHECQFATGENTRPSVMTHHIVRHDARLCNTRIWLSPQPLQTTYTRCVVTHHMVRHDALYVFVQFCISFRGSYRYFVTFTDDYSRYGYIYLMRAKAETFEKFKEFQNEVQN